MPLLFAQTAPLQPLVFNQPEIGEWQEHDGSEGIFIIYYGGERFFSQENRYDRCCELIEYSKKGRAAALRAAKRRAIELSLELNQFAQQLTHSIPPHVFYKEESHV